MKRLLLASALLAASIIAGMFNANLAYANTQDFTVSNFQVDYYLSRDNEGRSVLKTVESITAIFPEYGQNHGIERALPKKYDNHSITLDIQSVNDEEGVNQKYSEYSSNGNLVIRIGDANKYVHGEKTYVITYTQRDVTKYFANTNDDEFYWDVNGVGWSQALSQVNVTVHLDPDLSEKVNGKRSCYYGVAGSTQTCTIFMNSDKTLVAASIGELSQGQNMTISIGFQPHTFSAYRMTQAELFVKQASLLLTIACYVLFLITIILRFVFYKDAPRRKAVIAQYVPPTGIDLSTAVAILRRPGKIFQSAIISLAVKNNIKITEKTTVLRFGIKIRTYNIELLSTANMTPSESKIAKMLFGDDLRIGKASSVDLPKTDATLARKANEYTSAIKRNLREDGYLANKRRILGAIILLSILIVALSVYTLIIILSDYPILTAELCLILIFCSLLVSSSIMKKPLNDKGRELYDYLMGLKLFIKTAEQDRIRFLQTPSGAERVSIDIKDGTAVLKLYEKLLPYAIMFDLEKQWSKVLATYYEDQDMVPVWYMGSDGFSSDSFSSSLSSFSSSLGDSSSSGGSDGGGSSGGGGGGGGGGGW